MILNNINNKFIYYDTVFHWCVQWFPVFLENRVEALFVNLFPVTGTNVQEAMDIYGATRIGHGYRSLETQVLIPPGKR